MLNVLIFLEVCRDPQYQMPFENRQNCLNNKYHHKLFSK